MYITVKWQSNVTARLIYVVALFQDVGHDKLLLPLVDLFHGVVETFSSAKKR